jgi:hypothetical protein
MARACRHLTVYIQEKTAPGGKSADGTSVLMSIVVIFYRMQEESPSGKGPVAGLMITVMILKVTWSEEFIDQISNYQF